MNRKPSPARRALAILIVVGAMVAVVCAVGERLRRRGGASEDARAPATRPVREVLGHATEDRRGPVRHSAPVMMAGGADVNQRDLEVYYARRAYPGAPPSVPHPVAYDGSEDRACGSCHERGGFAAKFNAYTPVTPHPSYEDCSQCHVPQVAGGLFVETAWVAPATPALHRPALPGSPPAIPHTLHLRQDCLACHAGPAAPLEIRTSHPERVGCTQCHVPQDGDALSEFKLLALAPDGED